MTKFNTKFGKILPHIVSIILFLGLSYAYFPQVLEGKQLKQHDNMTFRGGAKEIIDHREKTGEETLWTNTMFSGMPSYLTSVQYKNNLVKHVNKYLQIGPRPASYIFIAMLGFYIFLFALGVNPWLALLGGIAYGLSSYNMIILGAGHNSKMVALAYMPAVIGAVIFAFRKNLLLGAGLFGLFFALELLAGHPQITYYGFLIILVFGIFEFFKDYKEKALLPFFKKASVLVVVAIIAIATNFTSLYFTWDYGKDSIRGKSELTSNKENKTSGLDKDYATQWSYGKMETFNLLIPNFMGGSSQHMFDKDSETYKTLKKLGATQMLPAFRGYWGLQPITSGPVYLGAIIIFLFVFGMFVVRGPTCWWIFTATILGIMLAWGKNFMFLTDLFLDYFPGYNKFRAVSMTMVIPQITVPLLALLGLNKVFKGDIDKNEIVKALKWSTGIVGGVILFFLLFAGGMFDFITDMDKYYSQGHKPLLEAIKADRVQMLKADALRSLVFVALAAGIMYFYFFKEKMKQPLFIGALALLITIDFWGVDKRYLNSENFVSNREAENPVQPTQADKIIMQDKDPNYRVMNLAVSTFNDATTSFFHKSIGGYHGAKMRRYQELIEQHISKNNMAVLNMLNTKYFITPDKNNQPIPQRNPEALGNAWFVSNMRMVKNADEEIAALAKFNPANECIVDERFKAEVNGFDFVTDTTANISLIEYQPNYLKYQSNSLVDELAVFSEVYYDKGWKAYIDGEEVSHFRVNFVLRAMMVPAGSHIIEYRFDPPMFNKGNKISLFASLIILLLAAGSGFYYFRTNTNKE